MKNAIAHIGGTSKNDILELPDLNNDMQAPAMPSLPEQMKLA